MITSPAWEAARAKLFGPKAATTVVRCVCSHSKYHHSSELVTTVRGEEWWYGKCIHNEKCGCEFYDEHAWEGGDLHE